MKTFQDLKFRDHLAGEGKQGLAFFENGYGVSVIRFRSPFGYGSCTSDETEWELAVIIGDESNYSITYNTDITSDVIGHLSEDEVSDIMNRVQGLESALN
jgi:hypothetical protein